MSTTLTVPGGGHDGQPGRDRVSRQYADGERPICPDIAALPAAALSSRGTTTAGRSATAAAQHQGANLRRHRRRGRDRVSGQHPDRQTSLRRAWRPCRTAASSSPGTTTAANLGDGSGTPASKRRSSTHGDRSGPSSSLTLIRAYDQFGPTVAGVSDGGFVITWYDSSATFGDARLQHQGADIRRDRRPGRDRVPGQHRDCETANLRRRIAAARTAASSSPGTTRAASARRRRQLRASRRRCSMPRSRGRDRVSGQHADRQRPVFPTIPALSDGGFVITWYDNSGTLGDSSGTSIKAQIFDATGAAVGTEFLVNTETADDPVLADRGGPDGWRLRHHLVSTTAARSGTADGSSIKAQISTRPVPGGTEFLVNTETAGQYRPGCRRRCPTAASSSPGTTTAARSATAADKHQGADLFHHQRQRRRR